ncbi:hypothetical protein BGZ73_009036 [Actinomortierella ambigua]|nr:hypothetical protein BGZ73_009036 [Actinomortierella ambigua]
MATFGACAELRRHASTRGAGLGAISFCAKTRQDDDLSGEPPSTAYIIGQFQFLKSLSHPHLCEYIEISKGKRDRLFVVSEQYSHTLALVFQDHDEDASSKGVDVNRIRKWTGQILDGLTYLYDHNVAHRSMAPSNVLLNLEGDVKLSNYGLYNMTKDGSLVEFNIGDPHYLSPRTLAQSQNPPPALQDASVDIWSLGVIMTELLLGEKFWQKEKSDLDELVISLFAIRVLSVKENDWIQACYHQQGQHPKIGINPVVLEYLATGKLPENTTTHSEVDGKASSRNQKYQHIHNFLCQCLSLSQDRIKDLRLIRGHDFLKPLQSDPYGKGTIRNENESVPSPSLSLLSSTLVDLDGRVEQLRKELHELQENPKEDGEQGGSTSSTGLASDAQSRSMQPQKWGFLDKMPLSQVFYLWKLAGGDVEVQFRKNGRLIGTPTIQLLPTIVQVGDDSKGTRVGSNGYSQSALQGQQQLESKSGSAGRHGVISDPADLFSDKPCILPLDGLEAEIVRSIHEPNKNQFSWDTDYFLFTDPDEMNFLIDTMAPAASSHSFIYPDTAITAAMGGNGEGVRAIGGMVGITGAQGVNSLFSTHGASAPLAQQPSKTRTKVPLSIREKDLGYQYQRLSMYTDLLLQYPASRDEILHHAKIDIPPLLRGKVWAAILRVVGDYQGLYDSFDKSSERPTDRQIELDVPRCHQYNQLMFSQAGHEKLTRILKTWVEANELQAYWQGLDSCCAPFLTLNFNDEALAFSCIQEFLPKYLKDMFLHDNSKVIHEYLAVFRHMLSFHDPELSAHLDYIAFVPQLYSISWFMTLFTHIFPLDKIYHLWDKILVGPSSLPLFVGIAILQQFRTELLRSEFNEAIGIFSGTFPEMDIEKCIETALAMCRATPPSTCWLSYDAESREQRRVAASTAGSSGLAQNGGGSLTSIGTSTNAADQSGQETTLTTNANGTSAVGRRSQDIDQKQIEHYWWDKPLPIEVLNAELAPRIHYSDLNRLRQQVLVIDIRPESEYLSGHYPLSIHLVPSHLELLVQVLKLIIKKKYVVVLANRGDSGPEFATALVRAGFHRVSVLMGGIDALRTHASSLPLTRQRSTSSSVASSAISPTLSATSTTATAPAVAGGIATPLSSTSSSSAAAARSSAINPICSCVVHRQKMTLPARVKDEVVILKCKTPMAHKKMKAQHAVTLAAAAPTPQNDS